ncbi:MAG: hypothetical protein V4618_15615 [Pseudomonadota bacterium]
MSESNRPLDLGGTFDLGEMRDVERAHIDKTPGRDSADPAALSRLIATFVDSHLNNGNADTMAACVFVHSPDLVADKALSGAEKDHHHLLRKSPYSPFGRLHFVAAGGHRAVSLERDCEDPEKLHDWLDEKGLLDRPIIWARPQDKALTYYPLGFADEDSAIDAALLAPQHVTKASVEEALAIFHDTVTLLPRPMPRLWHAPALHVPCEYTEKRIQEALEIALWMRFHKGRVEREREFPGSKIDFVIWDRPNGKLEPGCALELKVLREKHFGEPAHIAKKCYPATNTKAVNKGIKQAAFARNELGAPIAIMAAFDMRQLDCDKIMKTTKAFANAQNVECHRFHMMTSNNDYREKTMPTPSAVVSPQLPKTAKLPKKK